MASEVSEEVLQETVKCSKKFSCLSTGVCGDPVKCQVRKVVGKNLLFLDSTEHLACSYRISFGYELVCRCPVHSALHLKGLEE